MSTTCCDRDRDILRSLAGRLREHADSPENAELYELWRKHNRLEPTRPLLLAEVGGVRNEIDPLIPLECSGDWARDVEYALRLSLWDRENVADDRPVAPFHTLRLQAEVSDFGVQRVEHHADTGQTRGAIKWDAALEDLDRDFHKLRPRTITVDRDATERQVQRVEETFGDILPPRLVGSYWWTTGLTIHAINMVGLENLMLLMYDNPEGLHRLMAFLRDDQIALAEWLEAEGLLTLNNDNHYIGSGGCGTTDELPADDYVPGSPARLKDLWVLSESQETVGVSPEMFEEFIFPCQQEICRRFGLVYYGCCEPVHSRWQVIRRLENLRTVSISPWCDEAFMAEALGGDYCYARKPNPTLISTDRFDEDAIRADLRKTLELTRNCRVEFAMKDVHNLRGEPDRLGRWIRLAREEIAAAGLD
jgi:hypothetical protein